MVMAPEDEGEDEDGGGVGGVAAGGPPLDRAGTVADGEPLSVLTVLEDEREEEVAAGGPPLDRAGTAANGGPLPGLAAGGGDLVTAVADVPRVR